MERTILVVGFLVGWWILGGWLFVCRFWLVWLVCLQFCRSVVDGELCFVFIWWFSTNDAWFWRRDVFLVCLVDLGVVFVWVVLCDLR